MKIVRIDWFEEFQKSFDLHGVPERHFQCCEFDVAMLSVELVATPLVPHQGLVVA